MDKKFYFYVFPNKENKKKAHSGDLFCMSIEKIKRYFFENKIEYQVGNKISLYVKKENDVYEKYTEKVIRFEDYDYSGVVIYEKVDFKEMKQRNIKDILRYINNKDLSLVDRKRVVDVVNESLDFYLESYFNLGTEFRFDYLYKSELVADKLRSYGFDYSVSNVKEFKL